MGVWGDYAIELSTYSMPVYATPGQFLHFCKLDGATLSPSDEELLNSILNLVSRQIDSDTRRKFTKSADATVRSIDGNGTSVLKIDVLSVSALSVDGVALTEGDDFLLEPEARAEDFPYTELERISGDCVWTAGKRNVEITGVFGFENVPCNIHYSALNRAKTLWSARHRDNLFRVLKDQAMDYERWAGKTLRKQELREVSSYTRALGFDG
jgi:hypothetical protein